MKKINYECAFLILSTLVLLCIHTKFCVQYIQKCKCMLTNILLPKVLIAPKLG